MKTIILIILLLNIVPVRSAPKEPLFLKNLETHVPEISTDQSVTWDYDIVYVRAPRAGDEVHKRFYTDFSQPVTMQPGADLMLLHPDGSEELLVKGGNGSITDPIMSLDGDWVTRLDTLQGKGISHVDGFRGRTG